MALTAPLSTSTPIHGLDSESLPWARFRFANGHWIDIKVLSVDVAANRRTSLFRMPAGFQGIRHRHLGSVRVYTLSGRWRYEGYPNDFVAGSYAVEPSGATHREEALEDTLCLSHGEGGTLKLDEAGNVISWDDSAVLLDRYCQAVADQGGTLPSGLPLVL